MAEPNQERWLSMEQIAMHLGVNKDSIRNWIKKNNLPAHKVGKLWKFQVSEVDNWVRGNTNKEAK